MIARDSARLLGWRVWVWVVCALCAACSKDDTPGGGTSARGDALYETPIAARCGVAAPEVSADGVVRLAYLVGAGKFQSSKITPLQAPREDVRSVWSLLTSPTGYGFPSANVCVLKDEEVTRENFVRYFRQALVEQAKKAKQKTHKVQVLFFFSGHGSYTADHSNDEDTDGKDELFVFGDSWHNGVAPLRDDEFNRLVAEVYEHTRDIVLVLDSCHSGSAAKGVDLGDEVVKLTPPQPGAIPGDDSGPTLESMPEVTRLSAARDGTSALAPLFTGTSYFTRAFLGALSQVGTEPLRWSQVTRQMELEIQRLGGGRQHPVFQGDLTKLVFNATQRARPYGWDVVKVAGSKIELEGAPLPGWGEDAEIRIYDGNVDRGAVNDPAKSKAGALITKFDGLRATANVVGDAREKIKAGDIAVLSVPDRDARRLSVKLRTDDAAAAEIRKAIAGRDDLKELIELSSRKGGFTVEGSAKDGFYLRGPEGAIRNQAPRTDISTVLEDLRRFARQQVVLALQGETGGEMQNNKTLEVRLVPADPVAGDACSERASRQWAVEQCPNEEHIVPVCGQWRIQVRNTGPRPLKVGGAVFFNDGTSSGLPLDGENRVLPPHSEFVILDPNYFVTSGPPLDVVEHVVLFGTDEHIQIDWSVLTEKLLKNRSEPPHPLQQALNMTLAGVKSGTVSQINQDTAWTSTQVPFRVLANPQFSIDPANVTRCSTLAPKEYTVQDFDIEPYLPKTQNSLRKVLERGHKLANLAGAERDGVPYRQHSWSKGSGKALPADDALNLAEGIDCSRAIWNVFTRSGLPYTSSKWHGGYLATAEMFDDDAGSCSDSTPKQTLMHEQFDDCTDEEFRTGDVLVYQGKRPDTKQCVGHTVMVIDPARFIGWGSHGWDGSKDDEGKKLNDTGVEYQKIMKGGWAKWDRADYQLKACWRHREFKQ